MAGEGTRVILLRRARCKPQCHLCDDEHNMQFDIAILQLSWIGTTPETTYSFFFMTAVGIFCVVISPYMVINWADTYDTDFFGR